MNKLIPESFKTCFCCLILMFSIASCKKTIEKIQPVPKLIAESITITNTQTTATVNYRLSGENVQETGLYFSTDSVVLAQTKDKATKIISKATSDPGKYTAPIAALSTGTTYYYSIYVKDFKENYTYSNPAKFTTQGYGIHWQANFPQQIKLTDWLYKDVILVGQVVDADIKSYKVTLGTTTCMLWKIAKSDPASTDYLIYIQIPAAMHIGKYKLSLSYLGKEIFNDDLEVLKGNFYLLPEISKHPLPQSNFSFFQYDNKLYTIEKGGSYSVDSWNPTTNSWQHIGAVPSNYYLSMDVMGLEINGKIWFPPGSTEETFYAYTPATNSWETGKLYTPKNSNDIFTPYGTFVYNNLLYCMGQQRRGNNAGNVVVENIMKVFNPADKSWNMVMSLDNAASDYKGTVLNGKVYILATKAEPSTQGYKSDLYELDMNTNLLIKKPDLTWYNLPVGMNHAALFGFKNHIYMYGGEWGGSYISTDMYEYAPETDTWTRILLSPNSQLGGLNMFCNVFNNKVYLAFGLNYNRAVVNSIWELDFNKSL